MEALTVTSDLARPVSETDSAPPHQDNYINAAIELRTTINPSELLTILKYMEAAAGRIEGGMRFGPRPLDLDILLYGDRVIDIPEEKTRAGKISQRYKNFVGLISKATRLQNYIRAILAKYLKNAPIINATSLCS